MPTGGSSAPMNHKKSAMLNVSASAPVTTRYCTRPCTARDALSFPRFQRLQSAAAKSPKSYANTMPRAQPCP